MSKKILIGSAACILVVFVTSAIIYSRINSQKTSNSSSEFLDAIVRDNPAFSSDGKPVIEIASIIEPEDGWYIITIRSVHDTDMRVPVKIILSDLHQKLPIVLLGPDTHFTEQELLEKNIPDSVILELQKS